MEEKNPEGFCTRCGAVIDSFEGLNECPTCKSKNPPCGYENQVDVNINTHELCILVIWAERWCAQMPNEYDQHNSAKTLRAILSRINAQLPKDKQVYMLSQEIKELKEEYGQDNVQTNMPDLS